MIGQRVRRREDPRFITGQGRYVDDVKMEGALHARFVRSEWAHATITSIDTSALEGRDDVQVFTAADLGLPPYAFPAVDDRFGRPPLATGKARFVGDILAVVVADSATAAADAAEQVWADLEGLPSVTDANEAIKDEVLLFEDIGTNIAVDDGPAEPSAELFADCEVVVEGDFTSQRLHVAPIEPRSTAAVWEHEKLTIWVSTQTPHQDKERLCGMLGVDASRVRVVAPDVGGGFGGKGLGVEDVLLAAIARNTGRPVRWTETRSEHMVAMGHGRGHVMHYRLGGDRDGTLKALYLDIIGDAGAYPGIGAVLPGLTRLMGSGVYEIPKIEARIRAVATNATPTGPLRGAGRPEASQVVERAVDAFARETGVDPAQLRLKNFIAKDAFPYTTQVGATYDVGDYHLVLETALKTAGYDELRAEQARRREAGERKVLGIGMSTYVEITNGIGEAEFGAVDITDSGHAIVRTGSFSHGQGHETTFAQIASDQLGIPVEKITVIKGDTDRVPRGTGTYGSKSTQIGGAAARQAAEGLVEKAKELAAEALEADPRDMVLELGAGEFHVAGAPSPSLSWGELAGRLEAANRLPELSFETDFQANAPTFPFGAHVVIVEVDLDTGSVDLDRVIAVDDAGTIINPMIADGQIHGGVAAGLAQALFEEIAFDEDGNPQNANFVTYCIPTAMEFPQFEIVRTETPTPINPLGAKGIGESGTIGATPAAINAVIDALAHLGVRDVPMPANGERVWRAIQNATDGGGATG
jgi:aerobic carbon-monoxide dehydrogenase large subunit